MTFAHEYDRHSESVLDHMMCTATCPCYSEVSYAENEDGVATYRNDAYYKYEQLSLSAYSYHQRIFSEQVMAD